MQETSIKWYTAQGLRGGDPEIEDNHISVLSARGSMLLAGDHSGQLVLFKQDESSEHGLIEQKSEILGFDFVMDERANEIKPIVK